MNLCRIAFVCVMGLLVNAVCVAQKIGFNDDWKFKLGCLANAEQPDFDDSAWRTVNVPHDWSAEPLPTQRRGVTVGPFSRMSVGSRDTGQTVGGEGWYRKAFATSAADKDKLIFLHFEGIMVQAEVWVNGHKVAYEPYGYMPVKCEITPYLNPAGVENLVAVKAVNEGQNSRWYTGSGIYRPVWLVKTDPVYADDWDTSVALQQLTGSQADMQLNTIIRNTTAKRATTKVSVAVLTSDGKQVYTSASDVKVAANGTVPFTVSFPVAQPALWSPDSPTLYTLRLSIGDNVQTVPFGIRTIEYSAERGFLLNGQSIELRGGCLHHDNGLLGAMAIDRAEERKVELMKEYGYNAVRCAHNLPSEYFLQACDRLGLLVIDEVFDQWLKPKRNDDYHQFFAKRGERDMATMVRRDRNHPSIIMWSIGNEIQERADSVGEEIAKRLVAIAKQYDPTRPTTIAANDFWDNRNYRWSVDAERAFRNVDIAGYNYMFWEYEKDHERDPKRVMVGTESVPKDAAANWNLVEKHPYIIGDFVWTSMDYLGEAGLAHTLYLEEGERSPQFMDWPWYNAWCGDIDLIGNKKPQSYYRDILWRLQPVALAVHAPIPEGKREDVNYWGWTDEQNHWNWAGNEGKPMRVNVYTREKTAKLYLNDALIGEQPVDAENYTATFTVPYQAGTLRAAAGSSTVAFTTTGAPAAIRLIADRKSLTATRADLGYVMIQLLDSQGQIVPDGDVPVSIEVSGAGLLLAAGNADPQDMPSFRSSSPKAFRGQALAIVQPNTTVGTITVVAKAENLPTATLTIPVQAAGSSR